MQLRRVLSRYGRDLVVNTIIASPIVPVVARWRALRALGADIQPSFVAPRITVGNPSQLSIGRGSYINYEVMVDGRGQLEIGSSCSVSARVVFVTSTHSIGGTEKRAGEVQRSVIVVGDGTWIGAGAIILPGVTIGRGCVIGAGAVVTKDCQDNGVYVGVPARLVRKEE